MLPTAAHEDVGGNTTHEREAHYKAMAVISLVSHAHYLCCYSHYRWCWATHRPDFTCVATLLPAAVPQSEQAITNLSAVVVLAEEVPVSCPQEPAQLKLLSHSQLKGKLPLFSFWSTLTEQILQIQGQIQCIYIKNASRPLLWGSQSQKEYVYSLQASHFQTAAQEFNVDVYNIHSFYLEFVSSWGNFKLAENFSFGT